MCVCVCVGVAAEREATESWKTTSIWWNSSREPHFPHTSTPPTQSPNTSLTTQHTHTHTADVLENRLKYCDGWSSPDRLHSSKATVCISYFSPCRFIECSIRDWYHFLLSGFVQGAPGPHGNPGRAGPPGLKVSHHQLFKYITHQK